jgi:hypothetical protein
MRDKENKFRFTMGKQSGCFYEDRIHMELSPYLVETIMLMFQKRAMSQNNYDFQGIERERKDFFQSALDQYKEVREKYMAKEKK